MAENGKTLKIAVVGGGVAGIVAAHYLSRSHEVCLFEKEDRLGGHTNTIIIPDGPDAGTPIDTGFIVCNPGNYPNFNRFLAGLEVGLRNSDMSFGYYSEETGLNYAGPGWREFLSLPLNILKPSVVSLLLEHRRFGKRARKDLEQGLIGDMLLPEYLEKAGVSKNFTDNYLVPLAASIWSSADQDIDAFPAVTFLRFFNNHGMLNLAERSVWQTVRGGSFAYIQAFRRGFPGKIKTGAPVRAVTRTQTGAVVQAGDEAPDQFDRVVMACHADQTLSLLKDTDEKERLLLGSWRYSRNKVLLHTDASVLPAPRRAWASWNFVKRKNHDPQAPVAITYYMNRLQGLKTRRDYFVSLNQPGIVREEQKLYEVIFDHPQYTAASVQSQAELAEMSGSRNTFFCGSYMHYGFHEDAVVSALEAVRRIGVNP